MDEELPNRVQPSSLLKDGFTDDFQDVKSEEQAWIDTRRETEGIDAKAPVMGLSFSGGGVRSATFNLGVLQALAENNWLQRFDYLSTVSGGGYIAGCYAYLKHNLGQGLPRDFNNVVTRFGQHNTVLAWLRGHGSYLISGPGFSVWTFLAAFMAGTIINLVVLLPVFILFFMFMSIDVDVAWAPLWLQPTLNELCTWPSAINLPSSQGIVGHGVFMLAIWGSILLALGFLLLTLADAIINRDGFGSRRKRRRFYVWKGYCLKFGLCLAGLGSIPLVANSYTVFSDVTQDDVLSTLVLHGSYLAPFILGIVIAFKDNKQSRNKEKSNPIAAQCGLFLLAYGFLLFTYQLAGSTSFVSSVGFYFWLILSLILACSCNINSISMHSYYRDRLARAYLPHIDHVDNNPFFEPLCHWKATSGAALSLINTTVNTSSAKNTTLRNRKGDSMVLSPLFCGATSCGFRRTKDWLKGRMSISNAMAISGAAVDPDTIYTRPLAISFLMALFNIRLGVWLDNPNPQKTAKPWAPTWYLLMYREMLGKGFDSKKRLVHLSDGGHFENLGIYELIRRGCPVIIASDAGSDENMSLESLADVTQKVRADFGVEITIKSGQFTQADTHTVFDKPYLEGDIQYPDGSKGTLIYLKSVLIEGLTADVMSYQKNNPSFPFQSLADQFFDEQQFDAYRELGRQVTHRMVKGLADHQVSKYFDTKGGWS